MRPNTSRPRKIEPAVVLTCIALVTTTGCRSGAPAPTSEVVLAVVDEMQTPGLETELSGIYPHPTKDDWYYVVTNGKPPYKPEMTPQLPVSLRNKLLLVHRDGTVLDSLRLPDGGGLFGDLAFDGRYMWLAPLDPPALWKYDPERRTVEARYPLAGPAGGLDFDREMSTIVVQSYVGHPHLAVVDAATGAIIRTRWSDENCQGVAKVGSDWLTAWTSSWDPDAYSELWRLDDETGRPLERHRLDGIHAAMAPLDPELTGFPGFMALVHVGSGESGKTVIRRYRYERRDSKSLRR